MTVGPLTLPGPISVSAYSFTLQTSIFELLFYFARLKSLNTKLNEKIRLKLKIVIVKL